MAKRGVTAKKKSENVLSPKVKMDQILVFLTQLLQSSVFPMRSAASAAIPTVDFFINGPFGASIVALSGCRWNPIPSNFQQHRIWNKSRMPRIEPGTGGWETRTLPLCYAVPPYRKCLKPEVTFCCFQKCNALISVHHNSS